MQPPIRRWSFSALREYERCPHAIYLARVEKAPRPDFSNDPKHPLVRGNRVHKEAERFIRGEGPLTKDLQKLRPTLDELRAAYADGRVEVEQLWAFNRQWQTTDGDWENPEHWATVICDAVEHQDGVIIITDWKTGKSFGKEVAHTQQMQLYGIAGFLRYPSVEVIEVRLGYLDEGKLKTRRYTRAALPQMLPSWEQRARRLTNALVFPPKPNRGNCRFCDFSRNGQGSGACAYAVDFD